MKLFCNKCSSVFSVEPGETSVVNCTHCNAEIPRPESELAPGVVIGDFQIERSLSQGGMGEVFQARQISLDRQVALKVLQKEYTEDLDYVASLFREARAAAKISHPNIVQAYAVGHDEGFYYFAMELVRGDTLKNILRKEGALEAKRAAKIINDIAHALDVAWKEQKLVHQDIKPDNIMVDVNGFSKLADLGIAKTSSIDPIEDENSEEVLGTPQYISPEQLTGVPTDVRSDIYSLGATFYHIITGQLPYRANDLMELARMHDAGNLVPPAEIKADVPEAVNNIIVKMMARNINNRYQSAAELSADLERFLGAGEQVAAEEVDIKLAVPRAENKTAAEVKTPPNPTGVRVVPPKAAAPKLPGKGAALPGTPRPPMPGTPRPPMPGTPRPPMPGAPGGAPRPPMPGAPGGSPRPPMPGAPGGAPRPPMPGAPGGAPRPPMPAGGRAAGKSNGGSEKKNKTLVILLIILLLLVGGGGAYYFIIAKGDSTPTADSAENSSESAETPEENNAGGTDEKADASAPKAEKESGVVSRSALLKDYAGAKIDLEEDKKEEKKADDGVRYISFTSAYKKYEPHDMSRKEYLDRAQALIDWRMNNLSKNEEFLNKVDAEWSYLCYPVTEKEYKLLNQIMIMFSALDERYRCDEKRSKLRDIHLAQIEESKKRLDELERKKRLEQEALSRDKKEQEQQNAENAKLKAEAERQSKTGLTAIRAEADRYLIRCLKALRESALAGNDSKLKEEIAQAEIFIRTTRTFTAQEKNVLLQLQKTLQRMPAEYQALQKIFSRFFAIKARHHIRIVPAPGKPTVLITEIRPGAFVCRANDEEVIVDYKSMSVETRKTWLHHLKRTKIPSPEFYSDLLHGKKPNIKLVPKGFWKDVWPIAEKGMF